MNRFWNKIILPLISSINAKYIIEIGSATGINTKNILEYCVDNNARLTAIDPHPLFNVEDYKSEYGNKFEIYKDLSLNQLPHLKDYDVILIDGDHNWYTVYNELKIIEKTFKSKKFPLVFLHDVCWPYGRRDLYYNPENIPKDYRQPYKKLGMYPGQSNLKKQGGVNSFLLNAVSENNPKNGVLTAVENFIDESDVEFSYEIINAFHGLCILFPKNQEMENKVKNVIARSNLFKKMEEERINLIISRGEIIARNNLLEKEINENKIKLEQMQKQLKSSEDLIREKEALIIDMKKKVKELKVKINNLTTDFLEMEYLSNKSRPLIQRLISMFPSLYILFKQKNGFKQRIITIKGYKLIQKNNLLDIGYYLKNNKDVRKSGVDPIIHYIYHGFKENRKPNSYFDSNYYLKRYDDVEKSNMNPLVHYSLYGLKEGRKTQKSSSKKNSNTIAKKRKNRVNKPYKDSISWKPKLGKFLKNFRKNNKFNKKLLNDLESEFKVSIIMPTYNRAYIIKKAINSIVNQSFTNYELIICDDGSTDGTEKLLKKTYENYFKSGQFIYLKQNHGGVSKARNTCLERSSGDLIAYLDTDNYWEPEFLEKMVRLFQNNPKYDSAYCALEVHNLVDNKNYVLNQPYDRDKILKGNFIDLNIFMHRRKLYELFGGFSESLKRLVDWDLILRYTRNNEPLFLGEILAQYYTKEEFGNISQQGSYKKHRAKIYDIYSNEMITRALSKKNFITDPTVTSLYLKLENPVYTNYLRVGVFIEGELKGLKSCPYIRLYSPLKQLSQKERCKIFIYGVKDFAKVDLDNIIKCKIFDVIIIQRSALDTDTAKNITKKCEDNDIKVIYEFDDDLLSIDENNRYYTFMKNKIESMDYLTKNSDLLTVSTNILSERFNNVKSTVLLNYLVNELEPMTPVKLKNNNKSIDIGYYGTLTHDDDLLMIKEPISKIIKKIKEEQDIDVKFHIIGGMNKKHAETWFTKVKIPKKSTNFVAFMKWIKNNAKFDIMLAPLNDTVFNNAKSELKYIEYTALGMPGIYSDIPPYNSVMPNGKKNLKN